MKSRTSFFNAAVLKKDITRFAPLWGLYTVGCLLVLMASSPNRLSLATDVISWMQPICVLNLLYAALVAQVLFGDLFESRMCNALHALPLRRECWLLTHTVSGLLFSAVPNTVTALILCTMLGKFWYLALLWLAVCLLSYLFFFSVGVFSCLCAGNRLGAAAVYGLTNFFSVILYAVISQLFIPAMRGVELDFRIFRLLCPAVYTVDGSYANLVTLYGEMQRATFQGIVPEKWIYLGICAVLGVGFLALSVAIYRKRDLESAGDLISLKLFRPVFLILYTLCCGMLLYLIADLFATELQYLFLIVGIFVGFFTGRMLLERTVRVFRLKNWLKFAAIAGVLTVAILLTALDVFGIAAYVPEPEEVDSVSLSCYNYSFTWEDPQTVERICDAHRELISREDSDSFYANVQITYRLKSGARVKRSYLPAEDDPAMTLLAPLMNDYRFLIGSEDWDGCAASVRDLRAGSYETPFSMCYDREYSPEEVLMDEDGVVITENGDFPSAMTWEQVQELMAALKKDLDQGNIPFCTRNSQEEPVYWVNFTTSENYSGHYIYLDLDSRAVNTCALLRQWEEKSA